MSPIFIYNFKNRGACVSRLRGSNQTSTLQPDADNAAVGSHNVDFLQEASKGVSCFLNFHFG